MDDALSVDVDERVEYLGHDIPNLVFRKGAPLHYFVESLAFEPLHNQIEVVVGSEDLPIKRAILYGA